MGLTNKTWFLKGRILRFWRDGVSTPHPVFTEAVTPGGDVQQLSRTLRSQRGTDGWGQGQRY